MKPLSDKNFLEFCGEPLFIKLLKNAKAGGLKNFIVVVNKDNCKQIAKTLKDSSFTAKVVIQKNQDDGMAGGVLAGLEKVAEGEGVFVLGGNDAVEPKIYKEIVATVSQKNADGGILAKKVEKYFPGGYLQIDSKNFIQSIIEKPKEGKKPSNLVNIVAHFFQKAGPLKKELRNADLKQGDAYEQVLQKLFETQKFLAIQYGGPWHTIKYPYHVLGMMEFFLGQQKSFTSPNVKIADTARLRGEKIFIDAGAGIADNAVIVGPCYIGKNAVVGTGSLVRNSIIGEGCVIGFNTEVARSFLAKNVSTHAAYIGDSVVDEKVNFGAFSVTTNLRLDKKTIRITINDKKIDTGHQKLGAIVGRGAQVGSGAKLMPGIKIKPNELIKPNEIRK